MERVIPKIFNRYNAPKGKTVKAGSELYEYQYLDKDKKVVKKVVNVQEKIQSCFGLTDYKTKIANGEEVLNGITGEYIRDFRNVPGDKVDFIDFVNFVSNMDEKQIADFIQQTTQGNQETIEEQQSNTSTAQETQEATPENGASSTTTVEAGGTN